MAGVPERSGAPRWVYGRAYRATEVALVLVPAALAALVALTLLLLRKGGRVLETVRVPSAGAGAVAVTRFVDESASMPAWLRALPGTWSVLGGRIAIVGPAPDSTVLGRADSAPRAGLIPLHGLRARCNLAFGSAEEYDLDFAAHGSPWSGLGTLLRTLPWLLLSPPPGGHARRGRILGVNVDTLRIDEAVGRILAAAASREPLEICFVNADCLNLASRDAGYRQALNSADLCLPDGVGVRLAGTALGLRIRENTNGTDLFPRLCAAIDGTDLSLFLLGARPGVAEAVQDWIADNHPGVRIAGVHHGYFREGEEGRVVSAIRTSGADIVLTALGAPRQELWNAAHLRDTGASVAIGVGGLFDFYSGRIPRAPQWLRELGLEWTYRLLQEPRRMWRRYVIGNVVFLARVAGARLSAVEAA